VTQEPILTAVADKIPDRYKAALIHDPEQKISDKVDVALNYLDNSPCLLVLKDYHRMESHCGLDELFTSVVHKTTNIKVLLTTRVRPECLNMPDSRKRC
jgi:ATP/maltotriose-dependent transcriptional regulator MalT